MDPVTFIYIKRRSGPLDPVTFNKKKMTGSNGTATFFIILIGEVETPTTPVVRGGPEDFGGPCWYFYVLSKHLQGLLGDLHGPSGGPLDFF